MRNYPKYFYANGRPWSFHTAKTQSGHGVCGAKRSDLLPAARIPGVKVGCFKIGSACATDRVELLS
jgi:hypothetical protein